MDHGERRRGLPGLVGLQVADEVPSGAGQFGGRGDLLLRLLHLVLAEVPLTGAPRRADVIGAEGLGDGDQGDGRRVAAGPPGSRVDPRPDLGEVVRDGLFGGQRQEDRPRSGGRSGSWTSSWLLLLDLRQDALGLLGVLPDGSSFGSSSKDVAASGILPSLRFAMPSQ